MLCEQGDEILAYKYSNALMFSSARVQKGGLWGERHNCYLSSWGISKMITSPARHHWLRTLTCFILMNKCCHFKLLLTGQKIGVLFLFSFLKLISRTNYPMFMDICNYFLLSVICHICPFATGIIWVSDCITTMFFLWL